MYIDIHSHILPGIDDGGKDKAMALDMLKIAQRSGTGHIIATPHYVLGNTRYGFDNIIEKCEHLNSLAAGADIKITVYPGCEVFINSELLELYEQGLIGTLAGSSYMLIEFPMMSIPPYTDDVLYNLQLKGISPIIAHPERYIEIQHKPKLMEAYIARGILSQVNSGSITGIYGMKAKRAAMRLIKEGWVQFVASDAHSNNIRNPNLADAAAIVEKKFGLKMREDLFTQNALKIINIEL